MLYKLISFLGVAIIRISEAILHRFALLCKVDTAWTKVIASHTREILGDFRGLIDVDLREFHTLSKEQKRITAGGSWRVYILLAYRRKIGAHLAVCPFTDKIIREHKQICTAMFSVLKAGSHIAPHRGPYFGVLRCQIPLIVPAGDCGIRVADKVHRWRVGTPLVFDDTLMHEAWNRTQEDRVVLFLDFVRPFPFPLNLLNRFMIRLIGLSPFIGGMLRRSS